MHRQPELFSNMSAADHEISDELAETAALLFAIAFIYILAGPPTRVLLYFWIMTFLVLQLQLMQLLYEM